MAKNFVQGKGTIITVAAPAGGVSSGKMVQIRSLLGVAMHDADSGARLALETQAGPVFEVLTVTNAQFDVGNRIFYDSGTGLATLVTAGAHQIGVAIPLDTLSDIAKATAGTTVRVLLAPQTAVTA